MLYLQSKRQQRFQDVSGSKIFYTTFASQTQSLQAATPSEATAPLSRLEQPPWNVWVCSIIEWLWRSRIPTSHTDDTTLWQEDLDETYSNLLEAGISPVTVTWDSGNLPGFCDSQPQTHMALSSFNFSSYLHQFFVFFSIFQNMRFPFSLLKRRSCLTWKPAPQSLWLWKCD